MTRASGMVQAMFQDQMSKLSRAYDLLQNVMPDYFLKHVSEESLHYLLPLIVDIDKKPGFQIVEAPESVLIAYLKNQECNPINCSQLVSGRRVLRTMVHESAPFGPDQAVLVIEELAKDLHKPAPKPRCSLGILQRAAQLNDAPLPPGFDEAYGRLNWSEINDLTVEKIADRLRMVLQVQGHEFSQVDFEKISAGTWRLTVAVATIARCEGYYAAMLELLARRGYEVRRAYLREFTRSGAETDFQHKAVRVNTFYLQSAGNGFRPASLRQLEHELNELCWGMRQDRFESELCRKRDFHYQEVNLLRAAAEFVHYQLAFVDRNAYTPDEISRFMASYPAILRRMCDYFNSKFDPRSVRRTEPHTTVLRKINTMIDEINSGMADKDQRVRIVLHAVLNFLTRVIKSNFFSERKTALAFRLDPAFMTDYEWSSSYRTTFAQRPFGVFFFWRREISGFQIRFADLARGGWRTVIPRPAATPLESDDVLSEAQCELFREAYVLAHTQQHKNKDICEGGSRMVTLYRGDAEGDRAASGLWAAQRGIFAALLDLINYDGSGKLRDPAVVDLSAAPEILELGPDENMSDPMIEWIADFARRAGYALGSGIISGKLTNGINHKKYGVTSHGLYHYLLHIMNFLGVDPHRDEFSVKISGGPFGDVAGNLLKLLVAQDSAGNYILPQLKIVAITDALAAIYDPTGIDRRELARLIHRAGLEDFSPSALHGEGAYFIYNTPESSAEGNLYPAVLIEHQHLVRKKLPQGEFMKLYQCNIGQKADVFLPCGGRPRTINADNWEDYLLPDRTPSSRAIIEGANSFITPEARIALQNLGVKILKDCSANKCGVITSSWEVLSNLLLNESEFAQLHDQLIAEILPRLQSSAAQEIEWLWAEHQRTGRPLTELSDYLADRINGLQAKIQQVLQQHPELVFDEIILQHLPHLFQNYRSRLSQIPQLYREAIVAVESALHIAYDRIPYEAVLRQLAQQ